MIVAVVLRVTRVVEDGGGHALLVLADLQHKHTGNPGSAGYAPGSGYGTFCRPSLLPEGCHAPGIGTLRVLQMVPSFTSMGSLSVRGFM